MVDDLLEAVIKTMPPWDSYGNQAVLEVRSWVTADCLAELCGAVVSDVNNFNEMSAFDGVFSPLLELLQ